MWIDALVAICFYLFDILYGLLWWRWLFSVPYCALFSPHLHDSLDGNLVDLAFAKRAWFASESNQLSSLWLDSHLVRDCGI
jgi:hypothetical protein